MKKNITWHDHSINKIHRSVQKSQKSCLLWLTGLSGSGKSTVAGALDELLFQRGYHSYLLDGDNVRYGLNKDLGLSDDDRRENIRRIGEMSRLFVDAGLITICAFISPFIEERKRVRSLLEQNEFIEVFISTPLDVCEERDPKGLYKKARKGQIKNFTGIDGIYEPPIDPEIEVDTTSMDPAACAELIFETLWKRRLIMDNRVSKVQVVGGEK
ncbi:adenylyl-sulfate kinase [Desulfoluna spongiiphila]|uniref:adenylyl-sulfate kinase n=1 Tax=Desulfoluna spongiiphila TaxID=419481 RepID=UPI00125BE2F2|nr:adenylyl-sulfate kinase [Desulfoluna spongiiphila]VVS92355.1 adenylyl-sulfate kinase [Desulfoluna spongiiphila]